ncbi:hypothetical protein CLOP_g8680 [Closterium sp. NIES-67]|nr:hypothetical protein CLOP_g8680 [Closterium sp. NIES-67]
MAAVKLRNAEVQASGSPTKVMSSAYARQRTSGWAAAVVWSAGVEVEQGRCSVGELYEGEERAQGRGVDCVDDGRAVNAIEGV